MDEIRPLAGERGHDMTINHNYAILATVEARDATGRFAVTVTYELGNEQRFEVLSSDGLETLIDGQIPRPPVRYRGGSYGQLRD